MKKINIISLVFLLVSAQVYGGAMANPGLIFALTCQATDSFYNTVESDADDIIANQLLQFMMQCIAVDANLKQQLAASVNGYIFKGKPLDPTAIAAQNKELQKDIKNYDQNIKKLKGSNKTLAPVHKEKIKNRQNARQDQQKKLQQNLAAIQANQKSQNDATAKADMVKNLIQQNQLSLDQAIEYYIATFGQCYTKAGSVYGSSIIISSRYNKNMPITPNEYNDLIKVLNQAANQFGSTISITLALNDGVEASIKDVASYVGNMAPSSTSYATYAFIGLGITAATVAALAANNIYQGRDWSDTTVYQNSANQSLSSIMQQGKNSYDQFYTYITGTKEDGSLVPTTPSTSQANNNMMTSDQIEKFNELKNNFNGQTPTATEIINAAIENNTPLTPATKPEEITVSENNINSNIKESYKELQSPAVIENNTPLTPATKNIMPYINSYTDTNRQLDNGNNITQPFYQSLNNAVKSTSSTIQNTNLYDTNRQLDNGNNITQPLYQNLNNAARSASNTIQNTNLYDTNRQLDNGDNITQAFYQSLENQIDKANNTQNSNSAAINQYNQYLNN